jgi:hypothetical protein
VTVAALIEAFQQQASWCDALGSPFTASLLRWLAYDIDGGGVTAWLLEDHAQRPAGDAIALRIAGALHGAALAGRDAGLAACYPNTGRPWDMEIVMPRVLDFLERDQPWVERYLATPPQTNETRRAAALAPAFLMLSRKGPLHLLELGASAGLNLAWDKFAYRTRTWAWGRLSEDSPLIDTEWQGPVPDLPISVRIASRAGCDAAPIDIADPDQALRLMSYVWPDQRERMARLKKAIAVFATLRPVLERADAGEWLETRLAGPLPPGVTVIYHSIAWQYFLPETRARARAAIAAAAERADEAHRLAWVRFEHNKVLGLESEEGDGHSVDLIEWPSGVRRRLCAVDPHGRFVTMTPAAAEALPVS